MRRRVTANKPPVRKTPKKPVCKLGKEDSVSFIIGKVQRTLRKAEMEDKVTEFRERAIACYLYEEVLRVVMEYVEVE